MEFIKLRFLVMLGVVAFVFSSCASKPDVNRVLNEAEKELETKTDLLSSFHSAIYYPSEISLDFKGIIVGIEKSPVSLVTNDEFDIKTTNIPNTGETAEGFKKRLVDSKVMYISHIVQNHGNMYGEGNCALYNAYYRENKNIPSSINFCDDKYKKSVLPNNAYKSSWNAIDILKEKVKLEIKNDKYTHILLISMGWNTAQNEAIRNFNSIVKNIKKSSNNKEFNPLFIGVTWPSLWESSWIDPIFKGISYPVKAADADEVGFSWLGGIIHDSLNFDENKLPIIVIGHSFGARTTSMATCVGPAITRNDNLIKRNKIDLLISLQGAYSINRFFPDNGIETIKYINTCSNANKIVLTSSKHDYAIDTGVWVPSVGNDKTFNEYCVKKDGVYIDTNKNINCAEVSEQFDVTSNANSKRILYLNADSLIKYKSYLTGGGAHSDIYREEMGKFLSKIIKKYTSKVN